MIKKICLLLFFAPLFALAHDGEEHGETKTTAAKSVTYFSSEATSALYELLAKYPPLKPGVASVIKLYVSNFDSNLPVDSASMQVTVSGNPNIKLSVTKREKGIYEIKGIFPEKKSYNLTVNINSVLGPDLMLISGVEIGKELPKTETTAAHKDAWYSSGWFIGIMGFLAGLAIMFFALKRSNRKVTASIFIFIFLVPTTIYNNAFAHGDDDHGEGGTAGTISNTFSVLK